MFTCNFCHETLELSIKCSDRNQCKPCYHRRRKESAKLRNIQPEDVDGKNCIECNKIFNKTEFKWKQTRWSSSCKECINKKGYSKIYRAKKMAEDREGFIALRTESHRKWIEKNKERYDKTSKIYNQSLDGIIRTYLASGTSKGLIPRDEKNRNLVRELVRELCPKKCFYCGVCGEKTLNGIDRINSKLGYLESNCVPCCSLCNYIKGDADILTFLSKIQEICIFNTLENIKNPVSLTRFKGSPRCLSDYKIRAQKKNLEFQLTKEEFNNLLKQDCYICGVKSEDNSIGIDRIDNDKGYTLDNCRPCCSICNYMKRDEPLDVFLEQVKKIAIHSNTEVHYKLTENCERKFKNLKILE